MGRSPVLCLILLTLLGTLSALKEPDSAQDCMEYKEDLWRWSDADHIKLLEKLIKFDVDDLERLPKQIRRLKNITGQYKNENKDLNISLQSVIETIQAHQLEKEQLLTNVTQASINTLEGEKKNLTAENLVLNQKIKKMDQSLDAYMISLIVLGIINVSLVAAMTMLFLRSRKSMPRIVREFSNT